MKFSLKLTSNFKPQPLKIRYQILLLSCIIPLLLHHHHYYYYCYMYISVIDYIFITILYQNTRTFFSRNISPVSQQTSRKDDFIKIRIIRCGRSTDDHAVLFEGELLPPVASKVLQQGRRQMSKLPVVDQHHFQANKVWCHFISFVSLSWLSSFVSLFHKWQL